MKYPKFIEKGNTIGFVAPSFGASIEPYKSQFDNGLKKIKKHGYRYHLGNNVYASEGIGISNAPVKCAEELMDSYLKNEVDAIISVGGGELMCTILEYLDFDKMSKSKPKWFMGFSDNTNFTFLLTTIMDVASIYGVNASALGMSLWHKSIKDAFEILEGKRLMVSGYGKYETDSKRGPENPYASYNLTKKTKIVTYPKNEMLNFRGRLIGGCLDCLINICGTKFDNVKNFVDKYQDDGLVWYFDSCELSNMSNLRAMWQLKNAGWFRNVKGFIIGRPQAAFMSEQYGLNHREAFFEILKEFNVPVVFDVDLGHISPSMPLINGSVATINIDNNKIKIDMELI